MLSLFEQMQGLTPEAPAPSSKQRRDKGAIRAGSATERVYEVFKDKAKHTVPELAETLGLAQSTVNGAVRALVSLLLVVKLDERLLVGETSRSVFRIANAEGVDNEQAE